MAAAEFFQSFCTDRFVEQGFHRDFESFDHFRRDNLPNKVLIGGHKLGILADAQILLYMLFFGIHNPIFPNAVGGVVNQFDAPVILCSGPGEYLHHENGAGKSIWSSVNAAACFEEKKEISGP